MQQMWVKSLGGEDLLEKEMATHSRVLAWRILWTEEPGRLQSMRLQRVRHDWVTFTHSLMLYIALWRGPQSKGLISLVSSQQGTEALSPVACEELTPASSQGAWKPTLSQLSLFRTIALADTVIIALWEILSPKTQLCCTQIPDPYKLWDYKCVCVFSHFSCVWLFVMDYRPPGSSSVHGILQARILEWVAIFYSRGSSWPRDWTHISCVSCITGGFFTTEPLGKLKIINVCCLQLQSLDVACYTAIGNQHSWTGLVNSCVQF